MEEVLYNFKAPLTLITVIFFGSAVFHNCCHNVQLANPKDNVVMLMSSVFNTENSDKHNLILLLLLHCIVIQFLREFSLTMVMLNKQRLVTHLQTYVVLTLIQLDQSISNRHISVQFSKEGVYNIRLVTRSI